MAQVNSIREMFFEKGMNYADIARVTGHEDVYKRQEASPELVIAA